MEIKFVDFDWAGVAGTALYPAFMNHVTVPWPAGASEGLPLTAAKDKAFLRATMKAARQLSRRSKNASASLYTVSVRPSLLRLRMRPPISWVVRSSCCGLVQGVRW